MTSTATLFPTLSRGGLSSQTEDRDGQADDASLPSQAPASSATNSDRLEHVAPTTPQLATRIWRMFGTGMDTFDISKSLGIPEARVSMLLWAARCREKNLPADFLDEFGRRKVIAQ